MAVGCAMSDLRCPGCRYPFLEGAKFCSECGAPVTRGAGFYPLTRTGPEVRQGTVVSCDLADYTAMTATMYVGDSRKVVSEVLALVADVMARFKDGILHSVDRSEGDSVLYVFGYPRARDDDALRATTAALKAAAAVARLRFVGGFEPQIRVGVDTGEIVIEPSTEAHRIPVHGPACNRAARMRELAPRGGVVLSEATWRLVAGYVKGEDLGLRSVKGLPEQRAWLAREIRRVASSFAAVRGHSGLTPLVGRGQEIGLLLDRWQAAREGCGQVVFLSGEPGVGKSRLLTEVIDGARVDDEAVLLYQCTHYRRTSAFHPIVESMMGSLDVDDDTPVSDKRSRLQALVLGVLGLSNDVYRTIAGILSISPGDHESEDPLPPVRELAEEIQALMAVAVARLAGRDGSILILEDAHWADPSTMQVLDAFIHRIASLPTLLVVTHRPGFDNRRWHGEHVTRLDLGRLGSRHSEALVRRVDVTGRLPVAAIRHIVSRTDGVPLFVEELTKALLEKRGDAQIWNDQDSAAATLAMDVPLTLRDSLTARLDRVPTGKAVAQVAAIIGREFSVNLLATVMKSAHVDVPRGLADLVEAGLVFPFPSAGDPVHRFKHALVQDVARDSLLRDARQRLHGLVAEAIERQIEAGRHVAPEVLAHHYTEADRPELAVDFWGQAADLAARHAANAEAIYHLNQGLRAAERCADSPKRNETRLKLLAALARVLMAVKGYASDDVWSVFQLARRLFPEVGDEHEGKFIVAWGEGHASLVAANYQRGLDRGFELAAHAELSGSSENFAAAQLLIGVAHLYRGQHAMARERLELAAGVVARPGQMPDPEAVTPETTAKALAYLARTLWFLGLPDEATRRSAEAVNLARQAFMPLIPTQTASMCMLVHQIRGDREQTRTWIDRTRAYATEKDPQPYWLRLANIVDLWWHAHEDPEHASHGIRSKIDEYRATGARVGLSGFLLLQSEVMERAGRLVDASVAVDEALAFATETGEAYYLPEIHRRRAVLKLAGDGNCVGAEADAMFRQGIEVARQQQALAWELRCATSLARLRLDGGRHQEAADLLAPICGRITEGFDTPDVIDAFAVLAMLPAPSGHRAAGPGCLRGGIL
jgi:class 3 adenylate cyclase